MPRPSDGAPLDPDTLSAYQRGVIEGKRQSQLDELTGAIKETAAHTEKIEASLETMAASVGTLALKVAWGGRVVGALSGLIVTANVLHLFGIAT